MAIREFKGRVESGQLARMLVARSINVHKWISSWSYERRKVYFEIEFDGANVEERTVGDLYITKARDGVQSLALEKLNQQILKYKEKIQESR